MERLESHFRLQRQTMGILVQLNEAAVANGIGTTTDSSTATGESLIDSGGASTASFSDSSVSSRGGPWAFKVLHSISHWRARRDAFERARSFESRLSSGGSLDHCQPPRRMDSSLNIGIPPRYRPFRLVEDEVSSDTDIDLTAESATTAANRWRQSSPIRSPRGVEQRMRLLWREYLSQVVNVQLNNMGDDGGSSNAPSSQQPGAPDSGGDDQERTRYRLWLSTMVESLTSFFSQQGINSSDSVDGTPAPTPQPPTATTTTTSVAGSSQAKPFPGIPPRPGTSAVPQSFPYVSRFSNAMRDEGFVAAVEEGPTSPTIGRPRNVPPPWRVFPRVGHVMGGGAGAAGIAFGGAEQGPGQQLWTLRRNAESQVSLSAHLTYRIQAWNFCAKDGCIPDIRDPYANIVVPESKITMTPVSMFQLTAGSSLRSSLALHSLELSLVCIV